MGDNVWTRLFAQVVAFVSSLSASLSGQKIPSSGGASQNVPVSDASAISTSSNATVLVVTRDLATADGLFGRVTVRPDPTVICYSMENRGKAIPCGSYEAHFEYSPHFGMPTPHIAVPSRTYIEIHPANHPAQLEGCVAVGSTIDNDALDSSREAFDKLMVLLPSHFTVEITGIE
jgi:hypothetical protein